MAAFTSLSLGENICETFLIIIIFTGHVILLVKQANTKSLIVALEIELTRGISLFSSSEPKLS
jgi:hypothetical protein